MLKVKKLDPRAKLPTVAHPGEDLAYDIYSLEDVELVTGLPRKVRTGIAAQAVTFNYHEIRTGFDRRLHSEYQEIVPYGLLIRDRSSMAARGVIVTGGVIDHGYTGEITVMLTLTAAAIDASGGFCAYTHKISAGDKIAQMLPVPILTGPVVEVAELSASERGVGGFGSSGR